MNILDNGAECLGQGDLLNHVQDLLARDEDPDATVLVNSEDGFNRLWADLDDIQRQQLAADGPPTIGVSQPWGSVGSISFTVEGLNPIKGFNRVQVTHVYDLW